MEVPFAMALERGETLKLSDLNCRLHQARDHRAGLLPGVAARRAHRRDAAARRRCGSCCVAYGEGLEGEAALARALGVIHRRSCRPRFDKALDTRFARAARGAAGTALDRWPERAEAAAEPRRAEGRSPTADPGSYPAQLALGRALRRSRRQGGVRAARAGGGAGADGDRRGQSARGHGPAGREARRSGRGRSRPIGPLLAHDHTTSTRRASSRDAAPSKAGDAARAALAYERDRRDRSVRRRRAHRARPARAASATTPTPRCASSGRRWRSARPTRRRRTAIWPRAICSAASAPRPSARRWPRSRSRRASSARRTCCSSDRAAGDADAAMTRSAPARPSPALLAAGPRRAGRRAPTRRLPAAPDDALRRPAVDLRPHPLRRVRRCRPGRRYDFYDEPWTIDAPAAEQNLSRRVRTVTAIQVERPGRPHARRPARSSTYPWIYIVEPGNLRLQGQRGRRSCASSCCAAAR